MKASNIIQQFTAGTDLSGADSGEIRDFLDYLKEELLRENNELKMRFEESQDEIQYLKSNQLDGNEKDLIIEKLEQKLHQVSEKSTYGSQMDPEMAMIIAENKSLKANKIYYFYVIKEAIKLAKKEKKHQMKNAMSLISEEDAEEVLKILKEFKLSY